MIKLQITLIIFNFNAKRTENLLKNSAKNIFVEELFLIFAEKKKIEGVRMCDCVSVRKCVRVCEATHWPGGVGKWQVLSEKRKEKKKKFKISFVCENSGCGKPNCGPLFRWWKMHAGENCARF